MDLNDLEQVAIAMVVILGLCCVGIVIAGTVLGILQAWKERDQ